MSKNIIFTTRFVEGFKSNLKEEKKLSCFLFLSVRKQALSVLSVDKKLSVKKLERGLLP